MAEQRCAECRHWFQDGDPRPYYGRCVVSDGAWPRCNDGGTCPVFSRSSRLTVADIRERWPELWWMLGPGMYARRMAETYGESEVRAKARAQLLEALGVEEE